MVILYYKGISESLKDTCRKHGVQVYFKGGNTIKNLLMAPKDQDTIQKKVESSIDTSVTGWNAMRNTLESPQEHLERGSKNTSRHSPLYMIILHHWSPFNHRKFQHSWEGRPEPQQMDKRGIFHKGQ